MQAVSGFHGERGWCARRDQIVAELAQRPAGHAFEGPDLGRRHLAAPFSRVVGFQGFVYQRGLTWVVDRRDGKQFGRVGFAQKRAKPLHAVFGVCEQVLVAQLHVLPGRQLAAQRAALFHVAFPVFRREIRVVHGEIVLSAEQRQGDIASVADQMHDLGIGKPLEQFGEMHHVIGGLVAPSGFSFALCVFLEQPRDDRRHRVPAFGMKFSGQPVDIEFHAVQIGLQKVPALFIHGLQHATGIVHLAEIAKAFQVAVQRNEEMRFPGGERNVRVIAQPVLQHGGAGTRCADDEDRALLT